MPVLLKNKKLKTMKKNNSFSKYSLAVGLSISSGLFATPSNADTFVYKKSDGSTLLTDKRINKSDHKLLRHYKTAKKKTSRPYNNGKYARRVGCGNLSEMAIEQKTKPYLSSIKKYARQYQVKENLVRAMIRQESCFNPKALSHAGAMGLMQLMPGTADYLNVKNAWNSDQNIRGGVKYISQQLKRFKGNKRLALAAYNAGPGKVAKYKGIPPYKETQNYVRKIMAEYERLENWEQRQRAQHTYRQISKMTSDFHIFWGKKPTNYH